MSIVMIAYAIKKPDGRWLWTSNLSRVDEWKAEGHAIYTRRVWINGRNQSWFKPGDEWKPEKEK